MRYAQIAFVLLVAVLPAPRPLPVDSMGYPCVPESTDPKCIDVLTDDGDDVHAYEADLIEGAQQ